MHDRWSINTDLKKKKIMNNTLPFLKTFYVYYLKNKVQIP